MKFNVDKIAHIGAYFYLACPFLVFILGWLNLLIALPLLGIVLVALYLSYQSNKTDFIHLDFAKSKKIIIISLGLIFLWTLLSGVGGFGLQTEDHHYRNAIFRDLITYDWPVLYQVTELPATDPLQGQSTMLVYYMGFWLPAAVMGKLFGYTFANIFLFLWTFLGLSFILYFLWRKFKIFSYQIVLMLIFFGGLSIIGQYIDNQNIKIYYPRWAGDYVYSSNSWNFFYVFNQLIAPWLFVCLLLNQIPKKNIFFLYSLCFIQGPFSFLGLLPYIIWYTLKDFSFKDWLNQIKLFISFQNLVASITIVAVTYLYFSSNQAASIFKLVPFDLGNYLLFVLLEFGIMSAILFTKFKRNSLFYMVLAMLLLIPFVQLGTGRDFVERVSIPSLFIFMCFVIEYLFTMPNNWKKKILIGCILVGAIVPAQKIIKSAAVTAMYYTFNVDMVNNVAAKSKALNKLSLKYSKKDEMICDSIKTVNTIRNQYTANFMGITSKSSFYKLLARQKQ